MVDCLFLTGACIILYISFFFFKQKTAYKMRISDWSSDVCSSDLVRNFTTLQVCRRRQLRPTIPNLKPMSMSPRTGPCGKEKRKPALSANAEIGRASCRERVCQYV